MREKKVLENARKEGFALTFDDVRLLTGYSKVMPDDVNLKSWFSRNIPLNMPIVSAAMDSVTEYKMAIGLAKLGGLGILHKNLTPEEQAKQVARVKHHLNGKIEKPIIVNLGDSIEEMLKRREEKGYGFSSFPVLNNDGKLAGILTGNDFEFCDDKSKLARDMMTQDLVTGKPETTVEEAYKIMKERKKKALPLVDSDGFLRGMYVFSDVQRIVTGDGKMYNVDNKGQLRVGAAIGVGDDSFSRLEELIREGVDVVVIDTAHGDSKAVIETLKEIKEKYSGLDVVAGNISVGESALRLAKAGADGIKVGQGPGSICTTRIIAGVGRPQVSAVYDCVLAVERLGQYKVPVCADGGLTNSGDIPIAIAAGAHSVMMGSMLAGTDEAPGELVFVEGRQWKSYRGMGSLGAMEANKGSRERYGQKKTGKDSLVPEGVEGLVPYKGRLTNVIEQYVGGLRRGMGYVGAATIEELRDKGDFDRITSAGIKESHPHNILITRDAPNYNSGGSGE
jgi:IMP dehydrogenase